MTVAARAPSIDYIEDGITLAFPVPFRFNSPTDFSVTRVPAAGAAVTLAHGTHWSAAGGATDAGGTLTLTASVAGARLLIRRVTARAQTTDYTTGDRFPADSHEGAIDRSMLIDQEQDVGLADIAGRALLLPPGEGSGDLGPAAARANRVLGFGLAGQLLLSSYAAVAAAIAPLLPASLRGDPGSPVNFPIGLFMGIAALNIPAGVGQFTTEGYSIKGVGVGTYAAIDAPVVGGNILAQTTAWRKQSGDGRWWELVPGPHVTFDQLGAIGKAGFEANDIQGWKNISAYIAEKNGGVLKGRPTTYAVGEQTARPGSTVWAFEPSPVLNAQGLSGFLHIDGCGATLRCRDGLRYGAFEANGTPTPGQTAAVFPNGSKRSTPYAAMLFAANCTGAMIFENFKLDGNQNGLYLGGGYGDSGYQIGCGGMGFFGNSGALTLRNIEAIDHGQDGLQITAPTLNNASASTPVIIENCDLNRNGRQGCSQLGGKGFTYINCRFRNTAYGRIVTGPAAGFDMEAEGGDMNLDTVFINCHFTRNRGQNFVADSGPSEGVTFVHCVFIGGGFWTVWPRKPRMKFVDCVIVGSMPNAYNDGGAASNASTQFIRTRITNDPSYGQVEQVDPFLINGGAYATACLFEQCDLDAYGDKILTGMAGVANRWKDCRFTQQSPASALQRGTFTGDNLATGSGISVAQGSLVYDRFFVNGVKAEVSP